MEELISNDRQIAYHRIKLDYEPSPKDTLQFAYGDLRYNKMAKEIYYESDLLKVILKKRLKH